MQLRQYADCSARSGHLPCALERQPRLSRSAALYIGFREAFTVLTGSSTRSTSRGARYRKSGKGVKSKPGCDQQMRWYSVACGMASRSHDAVIRVYDAAGNVIEVSNAIGFAKFRSRSHNAVIRVY